MGARGETGRMVPGQATSWGRRGGDGGLAGPGTQGGLHGGLWGGRMAMVWWLSHPSGGGGGTEVQAVHSWGHTLPLRLG